MDSSEEQFHYGKREVKYSFRDQFIAVWNKSFRNQLRQYKTNICQISFPLFLIFSLFLLQIIVNGIISSSGGNLKEITRPSLEPSYLHVPTTSSHCESQDIELNKDVGRILYASSPSSQSTVGSYGGVPKDPITMAILGPGFIEPNPTQGGLPSGLLSYADTNLLSFIGLKEKVVYENLYRVPDPCVLEPQIVYPKLYMNQSESDIDYSIYNNNINTSIVGAYYFENVDLTNQIISYKIKYNKTGSSGFDIPLLMNFVSNALWRNLVSDEPESQLSFSGNKDFPKPKRKFTLDLISLTGPFIYHFIYQLMWPVMLQSIVHEKEYKLRDIMTMMGMKSQVYWLVTYIFNYSMYMFTTLLSIAFACALGFRFFLVNNFFAYFFMFFFWGHTMVAAALLCSIFFTKERTALVVGYFVVLANGILAQSWLISYMDEAIPSKGALFGMSVFPPWALFRGIMRLSYAVTFDGPGMKFTDISHPYYALYEVYLFFIVQWFVFIILAFYLENVLPIGPGIKKHPLFFLPKRMRCCSRKQEPVEDEDYLITNDVKEEKEKVLERDDFAIKIVGLKKNFGKKVAVNNLVMGVEENECFGFLGPNGAGKTSTINILCGYLRPDGGTAKISGFDLHDDIEDIHLQMGVCPQDDLLWADLTGPEHLQFYGRLKNLSGKELDDQVEFWLKQVNLHDKKTKRKTSSEYSGGMRRRLSVAIALIGNSQVVLLDEPTTGLDPASKHSLWDVIKRIKNHCAVLLTTHSMEEAEALCDRLSIFADGRLLSVGTSAELKDRYGQYYKVILSTKVENEKKVENFLTDLCGKENVKLSNSLAGNLSYEIPKHCIPLSKLTKSMQTCDEFEINHFGISSTTLEEVFIKLTLDYVKDEADNLVKKKKKKKEDQDVEMDELV